ncbi:MULTISPECIES: hypothetical protein [Vibrio]|uniref:hypothetical protein n=1 Tax=Vibrio TaxID=662 RepID=UPI001E51431C|nr:MULTISPECIES: hypothetical protein [Vibrio]MCC2524946.1 hypothetical protein [Vibrio coralliilyticus]USD35491.1 hypothetical protein J8Z27_23005 [Vibrio sp. SCSIO 43186]USD72615.1 hypothetical protein J4N41_23010 [Vibrio sp. SCSIO 43139]USD99006.1 hypothetical protein CTT30_23320 [Vibrio coralliilyticus]
MKRLSSNKSRQKGLSLIEVVLGTLLIATATIAAYGTYKSNATSQASGQMKDAIVTFFARVTQEKQQWGDYNGFSNTSVWRSDSYLPATMKSTVTDQFITPYSQNGLTFGVASTVTDRSGQTTNIANGFISVIIEDVPAGRCLDEVRNYIDKVIQVQVGATRIVSKAAMDTTCAAVAGTTDITLTNS